MYGSNDDSSKNGPAATQPGDFINRNRLRIDPKSGIASRYGLTDPSSGPPVTSSPPSTLARRLAALGDMAAAAGSSVPDPSYAATRRVQQFTPPTPYRDAQGKTLPQYRMGIGHRILGTLANFANGFAGNRVRPIYVGPGALNNRYYQDEQQRRQNLEAARQELEAIQGPANLRDTIDYRTIGKNPTGKGWLGRTFGGQQRTIARPLYVSADQDDNDENNDNTPQSR